MSIIKESTEDVVSYFMMSDGTQEYVFSKSSGSFSGAAKKMALMPFETDGQKKLVDIIQKYMIEKDVKSDDCSFICLAVKSSYDIPVNIDSKDKDIINHHGEDVVINHKTMIEDEFFKIKKISNSSKLLLEQKGKLLIILSIIMAVIIVFTIGISRKNAKKPTETTTKNTVTETKKKEKTTSKDVVIDCDKNSVSKENGKSENKKVVEKATENKQKPEVSSMVDVTEKTTKEKGNENE